jgi:predicted ArsR family transcriptional regulator
MRPLHSENATRWKILLTLKKKGSMSADCLSKEVSITPMGVRQHLLVLERNGIVEYAVHKHGVGRPGFLYRLTDIGDNLFPKSYQEFAVGLLSDIESTDGRGKIDSLFKRRRERIAAGLDSQLLSANNLAGRLRVIADLLQEEGGIIELEEDADSFILKQFNCPISKIAVLFKEACDHDLQLLREITGRNVIRQQCLSSGGQACVYIVEKRPASLPG